MVEIFWTNKRFVFPGFKPKKLYSLCYALIVFVAIVYVAINEILNSVRNRHNKNKTKLLLFDNYVLIFIFDVIVMEATEYDDGKGKTWISRLNIQMEQFDKMKFILGYRRQIG